jgi:MoaA/NifB/PqqE/SkfB family radical SAM enzyme
MNPSLRVILLVVDHCNLNCRGCCAFAPLAKEYFVPLLDLERDCAKLADLTEGQIEGIGVFGGEPLLYPDLPELFVLLRRNFPQGAVFILTNGTLLAKQPERFWLSCAENKIEIALTKYPIALDYVRLERLTLEKGLPPLQYWGGAISARSGTHVKTFGKVPLDLAGRQDQADSYAKCFCRDREYRRIMVKAGKIYPCYMIPGVKYFNRSFGQNLQVSENDYLALNEIKAPAEITEFLRHARPFCRYCNMTEAVDTGLTWAVSRKEIFEWT